MTRGHLDLVNNAKAPSMKEFGAGHMLGKVPCLIRTRGALGCSIRQGDTAIDQIQQVTLNYFRTYRTISQRATGDNAIS